MYLHGPLQMFGHENGVCSYLALEKLYGMLILPKCVFFRHLNYKVCMLFTKKLTHKGGEEVTGTPGPLWPCPCYIFNGKGGGGGGGRLGEWKKINP